MMVTFIAFNPEKSSTTKISGHIPCGYSTSTILTFGHIENKHTLYRRKYCMKKFCESLRENAKFIIDFEKKKMLPLTKEELKSHQDAKVCYICGKIILKRLSKSIKYWKLRDHCHYTGKYRGTVHSICNLKFNVPYEIPVVFHKDSNYDYYFIKKELGNEFEGTFECLGEDTEKNKPFFVPTEKKVIKMDKDGTVVCQINVPPLVNC